MEKMNTPLAILKLNRKFRAESTAASKSNVNFQENITNSNFESYEKHTINGKRIVAKIPFNIFQQRFFEHFD